MEEEKYGFYLFFYTMNEGDGMRWGDYRCEGDQVYLECDIHGDEIALTHTTIDYYGETVEVLELTDEVEDRYGNMETYRMYFRQDLEQYG